jgi:molybdopterin converting factor small subunit
MDLSYFANLAEIIGTTAIVVSLIYVAVQIRQNNRHLAHEAQRARAQAFRQNMRIMADNAEICIKDQNGEALTATEAYRMDRMWLSELWSYQTSFQQIPRNEIVGGANFFHRCFATMQSLRASWEQNRDTFQPDFVQYMEENVFNR